MKVSLGIIVDVKTVDRMYLAVLIGCCRLVVKEGGPAGCEDLGSEPTKDEMPFDTSVIYAAELGSERYLQVWEQKCFLKAYVITWSKNSVCGLLTGRNVSSTAEPYEPHAQVPTLP